jgi:adenylate cyclase
VPSVGDMVEGPVFEPRAILVADMVGYSRWLAHQPVATHAAFTNHLRHVFEPAARAHAGEVIKTTGDGIVAIFGRPDDAEGSAREIQSRLAGPAIDISPGVDLTYRLAVHYGQVMTLPNDVLGIDVNVAMHMQALAPPGGICVSGQLLAGLGEEHKAAYSHVGRKYIKNIPDPIDVYLLMPDPGSIGERLRTGQLWVSSRRTLSPLPRLGVAELTTYAEHQSQYVVGALAQDALLEGLSRFRDLFVISPFGMGIDPRSHRIGRLREYLSKDLALEYLIHGSCLIGSDAITLIIHFEYLPRRELIFAAKVVIDPADLGGMGRRIASECVIPIILQLHRNQAESWDALGNTEDEQAFRAARRLIARRTLEATDRARQLLAGILQRSGEIGDVYVALARAEHIHGLLRAGEEFVEALEQARVYARKAIEIDDLNPRAHGELALQEVFLKRHAAAVDVYQRALRLNPYDPFLLADWADCLIHMARADEAVPILDSLAASWPTDKAWVEWNQCDADWMLNQPEKIIERLRGASDQPHAHRFLAASYAKLGRMKEARQHAERVRAHQPNFSPRKWRQVLPWQDDDASDEYVDCLAKAGL